MILLYVVEMDEFYRRTKREYANKVKAEVAKHGGKRLNNPGFPNAFAFTDQSIAAEFERFITDLLSNHK